MCEIDDTEHPDDPVQWMGKISFSKMCVSGYRKVKWISGSVKRKC